MVTGRPHVRGDVLTLNGQAAARAIYASKIFVTAGVTADREVLLAHCETDGVSQGNPVSVASLIKYAWERDFRPVTLYGANDRVTADRLGALMVENGGHFAEVGLETRRAGDNALTRDGLPQIVELLDGSNDAANTHKRRKKDRFPAYAELAQDEAPATGSTERSAKSAEVTATELSATGADPNANDASHVDASVGAFSDSSSGDDWFDADELSQNELMEPLGREHFYTVDVTRPRLVDPADLRDLQILANAVRSWAQSHLADGLRVPSVEISGSWRDAQIVADLLWSELGTDTSRSLPDIVVGPGVPGPVVVDVSVPEVPEGAEYAPTANSAGGISFDSGPAPEQDLWQRLHDTLPPRAGVANPFFVYVTGRDGKFVVGGTLIDGATLARHVRMSPAFEEHASNPAVPVSLVGADPAHPGRATLAAREFAEALRGDGPYRSVTSANERLELDSAGRAVPENDGLRAGLRDPTGRPAVDVAGGPWWSPVRDGLWLSGTPRIQSVQKLVADDERPQPAGRERDLYRR
jgi:hypothetical protein